MNGLELSRAFYERCGKPMLEQEFPELLPYLAIGLFGPGSECFGYDDSVSRDHDFEPGFCLFLPEEAVVGRRQEFLLERAYAKLPRSFEGVMRPVLQPVGGARHGIDMRVSAAAIDCSLLLGKGGQQLFNCRRLGRGVYAPGGKLMQLSYGSMALLAESGACHQLIDAVSDVGKAEHADLIDFR